MITYDKRVEVPSSSNPAKKYVVALRKDIWSCSCPAWIYRRQICRHIEYVKAREAWANI